MTRLSLRFENMAERHAELAWRFGEPDECEATGENQGDQEDHSLWTLVSPLPPSVSVAEHLGWASECLRPHEAFVGELISLGGKVVLRLECTAGAATVGTTLQINARLLLPMAHAGVQIEFQFG